MAARGNNMSRVPAASTSSVLCTDFRAQLRPFRQVRLARYASCVVPHNVTGVLTY